MNSKFRGQTNIQINSAGDETSKAIQITWTAIYINYNNATDFLGEFILLSV